MDLSKLIFNKKKIVKFISGWREFYMFYSIVIQKILDPLISKLLIEKGRKTKQKKKKKSNIQLGTKKKGNFQKEKKEKDEIAGRIVKMQCRRKDETLQSRFCQSRTTSSNVKT